MEVNLEDLFKHVYGEIDFPFISVDLNKLLEAIDSKKTPSSFVGIPLTEDEQKNKAIRGAFRGIFSKLEPPEVITDVLQHSKVLAPADLNGNLKSLIESPENSFMVYEKGQLFWEERSFWPLAYSTLFAQLARIVKLFEIALQERSDELSRVGEIINTTISSEYPRNLPTVLHYAMASLGAWVGGASNIQFFSYFATKPQIENGDTNNKYGKQIGYSDKESCEFTESGLIHIPATLVSPLIQAQEAQHLFGSIGINEYNPANWPAEEMFSEDNHDASEGYTGLLLDKNYRTAFTARKVNNNALYGAKNVLRDHYEDFYDSLSDFDLIRCKHYVYPVIEVSTVEELEKYVALIPSRGSGGLFYRGQTSFYALNRSECIKQFLFGDSSSLEPSLTTSASRTNFHYDNLHFSLRYFLGQEVLAGRNDFEEKMAVWEEMATDPTCTYDLAVEALAQHYGFPTNGLDVTTSLKVAFWFAQNKFMINDGLSSYEKMTQSDWPKDPHKWPIVYVFQTILNTSIPSLQNCQELTKLGIDALRPQRQSAKFFLGGHSDHQNRLAESLVCAFRLRPSEYKCDLEFNYLFPNPKEDMAYELLLQLSNDKSFKKLIDKKMNIFHKEFLV